MLSEVTEEGIITCVSKNLNPIHGGLTWTRLAPLHNKTLQEPPIKCHGSLRHWVSSYATANLLTCRLTQQGKNHNSQIFLKQTQARVCVISVKRGDGTTLFAIAISLVAAGWKSLENSLSNLPTKWWTDIKGGRGKRRGGKGKQVEGKGSKGMGGSHMRSIPSS